MEALRSADITPLEDLPRVIMPADHILDKIADVVKNGDEALVYRQATMDHPFALEVTATTVAIDGAKRLKLDGCFAFNASVDASTMAIYQHGYSQLMGEWKKASFQDLGVKHTWANNEKKSTGLQLVGDRQASLATWFSSLKVHPYSLFASNHRTESNRKMATPPEYDRALLPEDLSNFMQLLGFVHRALGATVCEYALDLVDEKPFHKRRSRQSTETTRSKTSAAKAAETPSQNTALLALDNKYLPDESYNPNIKLDDVFGVDDDTMQKIRRRLLAAKHPELAKKYGRQSAGGILALGPPGTGKTTLAYAVANEWGAKVWEVNSSDIVGQWAGRTAPLAEGFFDSAIARSKIGPVALLLNEFESLAGATEREGDTTERTVLNGIVKRKLEAIAKGVPNLMPIATTNNMGRLDPAVVRVGRFDIHAYMKVPDAKTRSAILWSNLQLMVDGRPIFAFAGNPDQSWGTISNPEWQEILHESEGFNGAVLKNIIEACLDEKLEEHIVSGRAPDQITLQDILRRVIAHRQQSHYFHDEA